VALVAEKTRVVIYNREYVIDDNGLTPLEASALANYVNDKMMEIAQQTNIVDTSKLAVLAALNIADELFRLKENKETNINSVDKKVDELIIQLDNALAK
jgi:cell division protein ZapA